MAFIEWKQRRNIRECLVANSESRPVGLLYFVNDIVANSIVLPIKINKKKLEQIPY